MGPNYLRFLAAVDKTGTIRDGGQAVGWSYRTCLNRLRRMERALGRPVLLTKRGGKAGGSARLTPEARRFVRVFARWQQAVEHLSRRAFERALQQK
jgi:molybdate transport system regulatory protein